MKPKIESAVFSGRSVAAIFAACILTGSFTAHAESVARKWNEQNLQAIRIDFPAPTVHSRNLFHVSVAMWDAWAAYDDTAVGYIHNESATAKNIEAARNESVSYAAYRVLVHRYKNSVGAATTLASLDALMNQLGYDPAYDFLLGNSPAAVGNRVADAIISYGFNDGANEQNGYVDTTGYQPVNDPLIIAFPGATMNDPNRWQPLAFDFALTQNGLEADQIQTFLQPHWGDVKPFALQPNTGTGPYLDPGPPPTLGGKTDAEFKANTVEIIDLSSRLDPDNGVMIDASPASQGNNTLGLNDGAGRPVNPKTGQPYASQIVPEGDFGRVLAEFWADGPDSETPPGHWNTIANELVSDSPDVVKRIGGTGDVVNDLEWDVKLYFTLNGSVHDGAIAAWNCKWFYDYVRPISTIRYMGGLGQSSDPNGLAYNPHGLPIIPGLIELVTGESTAQGERHEHLAGSKGQIAIYTWPGEPQNPATQYSGATWILAEQWLPYQRDTFVTPAFAAYVSGHSCFSRASAEVLTAFTGDPFFPGGLGEYVAPQNSFLAFERGPSTEVRLQWATYYDASDQSGKSRFWGGIHLDPDDGNGRIMGAVCGIASWELAQKYFDGSILGDRTLFTVSVKPVAQSVLLQWNAVPGYYYKIESSTDLVNFSNLTGYMRAEGLVSSYVDPLALSNDSRKYYRVVEAQIY